MNDTEEKMDKNVQFRTNQKMVLDLEDHVKRVSSIYKADKSAYLRNCIDFDLAMWRKSPYIATESRNFLLVTHTGAFVFYRRESLRFNDKPESISAGIQMKHEKIRDYLRHGKGSEAIRQAFRLNMFVCREPHAQGQQEHEQYQISAIKTDTAGVTSKTVEFDIRSVASTDIQIETLTILEDYVQRCEPGRRGMPEESLRDEAAIDVELPTEKLEFVVVLDPRLYEGDSRSKIDLKLKSFLKNTRGAIINDKDVRKRFKRLTSEWPRTAGEAVDDFYDDSLLLTRECMSNFTQTLQHCREHLAEHFSGDESDRASLEAELTRVLDSSSHYLYMPDMARFYRLTFPQCRMGLRIAVGWYKPERSKGVGAQ
jgi:hypothetical protein